jgi:hypothetical protein
MKAWLLIGLTVYWILFILLLTPLMSGNPFVGSYSINANTGNFTGIDPNTDIEDVTLFTAVGAVIGAIGNFFLFAFLGVTTSLSGIPQLLFSAWQIFITIITSVTLISMIYEG